MFRVGRDGMDPMCGLPKAGFMDLEELHKLKYGKSIRESADSMLAGSSHSKRRSNADKNLKHPRRS